MEARSADSSLGEYCLASDSSITRPTCPVLELDGQQQASILEQTARHAIAFLDATADRPAAAPQSPLPMVSLPETGLGAAMTLDRFYRTIEPHLSGSSGPRYLGFVTGGSTPAAVAADWLTSAYDQNAALIGGSAACAVELQALALLRSLFQLPTIFEGALVTGATMANFTGLAVARQWWGERQGVNVAEAGLAGLPALPVLSATPHVSALKALSMLGLGRRAIEAVPTLPGREAMDMAALERQLQAHQGAPVVVLASACTVNTADFDDLETAAALCRQYGAWLHVDAAFGLFAACSPEYSHWVKGIGEADSIAADGHKWLNVPYDCGFVFTRHLALHERTFQTSASYLDPGANTVPELLHRTPENSRRFRALPVWIALLAYGRQGYREIVESNCAAARSLGEWISAGETFELLAPVRLNIVCFALRNGTAEETKAFLKRLEADGRVYLTPTTYGGRPGIRAAFSNWRTTMDDVAVIQAAMKDCRA